MPRHNQTRLRRHFPAPAPPPRPANDDANDDAIIPPQTRSIVPLISDPPASEFDRAWDIGRLLVANIRRGRPHGMW